MRRGSPDRKTPQPSRFRRGQSPPQMMPLPALGKSTTRTTTRTRTIRTESRRSLTSGAMLCRRGGRQDAASNRGEAAPRDGCCLSAHRSGAEPRAAASANARAGRPRPRHQAARLRSAKPTTPSEARLPHWRAPRPARVGGGPLPSCITVMSVEKRKAIQIGTGLNTVLESSRAKGAWQPGVPVRSRPLVMNPGGWGLVPQGFRPDTL